MKKLLISLFSIAVVGAVAFGATTAFFSDTEISTGNTLAAGEIDLQVDNTCYYNGDACTNGFWGGEANIGVGGSITNTCDCNWELSDLDPEHLFFDLVDIKPGDWEEDTISLHVKNNDSWLCANVTLTSDDDNSCTEPEEEAEGVGICQDPGLGLGDLADEIVFLWWADDGDNVLETDEETLPSGAIGNLGVGQSARVALADSLNDIWNPATPSAFPGGETRYIGKGWCFGEITEAPIAQDGVGATDPVTNGPNTRGAGFECDGAPVGNASQTDSLTMDIGFEAVQSRNNEEFLCNPNSD
ncbi:hypothetical protein HYS94_04320 [Candidatus Daviesbacteria bacterium]|nr:hypothetical protein [Candidatus Daviesbacteria bacterium]